MWYDEAFFRQLLDNLYDGVYFVDNNRVITYWNKGAERLSGFTAAEVIGRGCRDNILVHVDTHGCQLCLEGCPLGSTMADGKERQSEVFMNHKAGHRVPVKVSASPIRNADGFIIGAVEIFRDNSTRTSDQQLIEDLQNMAFLDPLTGLANRRFLQNALQRQLEELHRYGWPFGVLFFDVDHFKLFNDQHGHEVGDAVLKMVSKTMANCSRSFDTVGRWGGEEFVAIIANADLKKIIRIADRFRLMIEQSGLVADEGLLRVTVSIGAACAVPTDTVESLLERADALMYQSKRDGRNRVTGEL